jgi:carbonic anhydrase
MEVYIVSDNPILPSYEEILTTLEKNISVFENRFPLQAFTEAGFKQHPVITLLTCSDSRVPVNIFGPAFNRIFSVENIGNQFRLNEESILYGLLHLHTPVLIIAGHTDCGAIKAAETDFSSEPHGIRKGLSVVKNSLEDFIHKTGFTPSETDPGLRATQLAEVNIDMQIDYLKSDYRVSRLIADHHLTVIGIMIDLHNVYGNGYGNFIQPMSMAILIAKRSEV